MKHRKLVLTLVLMLTLTAVAGVTYAGGGVPGRHDFTESSAANLTSKEYLIVAFKDPPAASYRGGIGNLKATKPQRGQQLDPRNPDMQVYVAYLAKSHQDFRAYLRNKAPQAEVAREFFLVQNALVVRLNGANAQVLAQGPGVRVTTFSSLYRPTMNVSVNLIRASDLWDSLGGQSEAGTGIKVGVIDTGIDDSNEFFSCKDEIVHKVYASGVAGNPSNVLIFDHGTHVAGTIGGCLITLTGGPITGEISGVAPGVELRDYNVFPGFGAAFIAFGDGAFSHDIIAALEDTVADGMDVVNMSLGGRAQGPHDLLAEAVDSTVDAGIVVAVAAGNEGPGDSTVGSPGSAANALTGGASTNPHFIGINVTVGAESFGAAVGDFLKYDPAITAAYAVTTPANGCSAIAENLSAKIALIDRGACTFTTKIRNAQNAGALGVLIVNNVAGDPVGMGHDGTDPFPTIPAAMLGKADGNAIKPSGTATVDGTVEAEVSGTADVLAGFSSRGPTPFTFLIKPDVTAPGVNVYSSVFGNEFAMAQGTSMAAPHLAGSAALLLDLHPDWSPFDVKSALVNTADRVVTDHVNGAIDPGVLARGGGRVNLVSAAATPLTFHPASASFGYWTGNKAVGARLDLAVTNVTLGPETCDVTVTGSGIASSSVSSFTLPAGQSTSIQLTLNAGKSGQTPSGDYDGDVLFDCTGSTLRVPWWVRINRQQKP